MNLEKLQTTREAYLTVIRQQLEWIDKSKHLSDVVQFNAILDDICKTFEDVKSLNKTIEGLSDIHSLKKEIIQAKKHSLDIQIKLRHLEEYRKTHAFVVEQQIPVDCQESQSCTGPLNTFTQAHNNEQRPNKSFLKRSLSFDSLRKGPVGNNDSFIRAVEIYVQNKPKKRKLQRSQSCEKSDEFGKTKPWSKKRSSSCDGRIENTKKSSVIRDLASQEEFGNWTKCVLALNRTREALLSPVKVEFKELDMSFPEDEFAIFRKCLKCRNVILNVKTRGRNVKREDTKKKLWECEHTSCETIFKELLGNLRANNKWTVIIIPNSGSSQSGKLKNESSDCAWEIGRLYTYAESAEEERINSTLGGLDVAKIIKLMRCCKLFEFDGCDEVYEEVLKKRNVLMHSPNNMTTKEELTETFKRLYDVLKQFKKFPACDGALEELQKFEQDPLVVDIESPEFKRQEEEALQLQAAALPKEVLKSKETAESLQLLLKSTSDRLERIQSEQQEERDRMKNEISRLKEIQLGLLIKVDSDSKKYTSSTKKTFEKNDNEVKSIKNTTTMDSSPEKPAVQQFQQTVGRQINDMYYTKLTQLQQANGDLKLEIQTLQDKIKVLQSQVLECQTDAKLRFKEDELINARDEIKKLLKTKTELEDANNKTTKAFNHNRKVATELKKTNTELNAIIKKLSTQNEKGTKALEELEKGLKGKFAQEVSKNMELETKLQQKELEINEARKEISTMRETAATEIASLETQNEKITKQNETFSYLNDKIKKQSQYMDQSEVRMRVEMVLMADESALSEINKVLGKPTSGN